MRKRKKVTKYRGSHTHGGGSKKKRRGAGHRGGRGNAGSGKRGDAKKPSVWKLQNLNVGFHHSTSEKTVTVQYISNSHQRLLREKNAIIEDNTLVVDLTAMGYDKLVSKGKPGLKMELRIAKATTNAIKSIESMQGKVVVKKEEE